MTLDGRWLALTAGLGALALGASRGRGSGLKAVVPATPERLLEWSAPASTWVDSVKGEVPAGAEISEIAPLELDPAYSNLWFWMFEIYGRGPNGEFFRKDGNPVYSYAICTQEDRVLYRSPLAALETIERWAEQHAGNLKRAFAKDLEEYGEPRMRRFFEDEAMMVGYTQWTKPRVGSSLRAVTSKPAWGIAWREPQSAWSDEFKSQVFQAEKIVAIGEFVVPGHEDDVDFWLWICSRKQSPLEKGRGTPKEFCYAIATPASEVLYVGLWRQDKAEAIRAAEHHARSLSRGMAPEDLDVASLRAFVRNPGTSGSGNRSWKYLSLQQISRWVPLMRAWGVSEVARSPRGFLTAYKEASGRSSELDDFWADRRHGFLARHMAQVEGNREALWKTYKGQKVPTRRHLALIAWAYSPEAAELARLSPPEGLRGSRLKAVRPGVKRKDYVESTVLHYNGNPNGQVSAERGAALWDGSSRTMWINVDGRLRWEKIAGSRLRSVLPRSEKKTESETIYHVGDPNGVVQAAPGSMVFDPSSGKLWVNVDGLYEWENVKPGNGS